jgi:hypothetical protein
MRLYATLPYDAHARRPLATAPHWLTLDLPDTALWDSMGVDSYRRLRALAAGSTDMFVICFAVDDPESYASVRTKVPKRHFALSQPSARHTTHTAATDAHVSVHRSGCPKCRRTPSRSSFWPSRLTCVVWRAPLSLRKRRCVALPHLSAGGVRRSQCREHSINPPPQRSSLLPYLLCNTRAVSSLRKSGHRATPVSPLTFSLSFHFCVALSVRCSYALSRGFGAGHERAAHANPGVVPGTHPLPTRSHGAPLSYPQTRLGWALGRRA